jgi:hypothetical protein
VPLHFCSCQFFSGKIDTRIRPSFSNGYSLSLSLSRILSHFPLSRIPSHFPLSHILSHFLFLVSFLTSCNSPSLTFYFLLYLSFLIYPPFLLFRFLSIFLFVSISLTLSISFYLIISLCISLLIVLSYSLSFYPNVLKYNHFPFLSLSLSLFLLSFIFLSLSLFLLFYLPLSCHSLPFFSSHLPPVLSFLSFFPPLSSLPRFHLLPPSLSLCIHINRLNKSLRSK